MNILYYQNLLKKELLGVIEKDEVEITTGYKEQQTLSSIDSLQAVKELFEIGLDINTWITIERIDKDTVLLLEEIIFNCDNIDIVKLCISHLQRDFFENLTYKKQCSVMEKVLDKYFLSKDKISVIETLFDKGFKIRQNNSADSPELDWASQAHSEIFEVIERRDKNFKWNYHYPHAYYPDVYTSLMQTIEEALEDNKNHASGNQAKEEKKLLALQDRISVILNFHQLDEVLLEKSAEVKKMKI